MTCCYAGANRQDAGWHMARHSHSHHEMVLVVQGSERVQSSGHNELARAGDALLFPAGQAHEEWAEELLETWYWGFTGPLPEALPLRVADHDGRLRQIGGWLLAERASGRLAEIGRAHV